MPVIIDRGIEEYREPEVIGWVRATRRAAVGLCGLFAMPEGRMLKSRLCPHRI
jgi:hypothetical protein